MSYIYGAPNNASKWQMGFNLAFKGLRMNEWSYKSTPSTMYISFDKFQVRRKKSNCQ
jgi:hypothetical protein